MTLNVANLSAQEQPKFGSQSRRGKHNSLLASTALVGAASLLGATMLGFSSERASAACVVTVSPNIVCSGVNSTPLNANGDNAAVTTTPGFSVNSDNTFALSIAGNGALSYIDANASTLNYTAPGPLIGDAGLAVQTTSGALTLGSIIVQTAGNLTGNIGFRSLNSLDGATSVTLTGLSTGLFRDAINVTNTSRSTDLILNVGRASGFTNGIFASNFGRGATSVTATGSVFGGTQAGIVVVNGSSATSLTVNAAEVTGGTQGIQTNNTLAGGSGGVTSVTASGLIMGVAGDGIQITNRSAAGPLTTLTVNAVDVVGGINGIAAQNLGNGAASITSGGTVRGTLGNGIDAYNAATSLTINSAAVSGGNIGINARNDGTGVTSVTATGDVGGESGNGIYALNRGVAPAPGNPALLVNATNVRGGTNGIYADNQGSGAARIIATGDVIGNTNGIFAFNNTNTTDLRIAGTAVSGSSGIYAENRGSGATSVSAARNVVGTANYGILAANGVVTLNGDGSVSSIARTAAFQTDLFVNVSSVSGGVTGIYASNNGSGATNVAAVGAVNGTSGDGIFAFGDTISKSMTVNATNVSGGIHGINARNGGVGTTNVTATGLVTGLGESGIYAANYSGSGTGLTVSAADVAGGRYGIYASTIGTGASDISASGNVTGGTTGIAFYSGGTNAGTGATTITTKGAVVGTTTYGILAVNGYSSLRPDGTVSSVATGTATDLIVDAKSASGGVTGIYAVNAGTGATSITTSGLIEGGSSAIFAESASQPIVITTNGLVRNASQLPSALAITATGGPVTLTNTGGLIGTLRFGAANNLVANNATWNTAGGTNEFGGGASQLINAAGVSIISAGTGSIIETTSFDGLRNFVNRGIVTLQDGGAGDVARFGGNASFVAGSVQAIDVNKTGLSDRVIIDGAANITGTTLNVANQGGFTAGTRYTVLSATGGLTGTYASVTGDVGSLSLFLSVVDHYDANNAYLDVSQARSFASVAQTLNQIATAGGLSTLPTSNPLSTAVLNLATEAQARRAFDNLSGEVHASMKTALVEDSHFIRDAAIDRVRQSFDAVGAPSMTVVSFAPDASSSSPASTGLAYAMAVKAAPMGVPAPKLASWGQAFGSWGRTDGDGNAARLNRSTGGVVSGFDGAIAETWRVGLMGGYSQTNFNVRDRASSGKSDNYHVGIYGGTQWGALGFRAGAAYTRHDISTARSVVLPGFADSLSADYSAGTTQVFGELGYRMDIQRFAFEPFANLAYVNLRTDSFTERGGSSALTSSGSNTDVTFTTLGLRASTGFMAGATYATAQGTLGWRHAFSDVTPFSTFAFTGGSAFSIAGVPIARNAAVIDAGIDFAIAKNATIGVSYNGQFGNNASDNGARGNLTVRF